MKAITTAEAHVLDRIMFLLEEGSVGYLSEEDSNFNRFIDELYQMLQLEATNLRNA